MITGLPPCCRRWNKDLSSLSLPACVDKTVAGSCLGSPTMMTFEQPASRGCRHSTSEACAASSITMVSKDVASDEVASFTRWCTLPERVAKTISASRANDSSSSSRLARICRPSERADTSPAMIQRFSSSSARYFSSSRRAKS